MLHKKLHLDGWTSENHHGRCGQSCGCCRAHFDEPFGSCPVCSKIAPAAEVLYRRVRSFLAHWACSDLTRKTLQMITAPAVQQRVFGKNVFKTVLAFIGVAEEDGTKHTVGTLALHLSRQVWSLWEM